MEGVKKLFEILEKGIETRNNQHPYLKSEEIKDFWYVIYE
jgi:hypothetical protein